MDESREAGSNSTSYCCPVHEGYVLERFCATCGKLICWECTAQRQDEDTCNGHNHVSLEAAFDTFKSSMTKLVEEKLATVDVALGQINERCTDISTQAERIERHILSRIEQLHKALDERKKELISQLHLITKNKRECLETQRDQIQSAQEKLKSVDTQLRLAQTASPTQNAQKEVLMMKSTIEKKVGASLEADALKPLMNADMTFVVSATTDIKALCGQLSTPIVGKCGSTVQSKEFSVAEEENIATVEVDDSNGQPIKKPIDCSGELVSDINNEKSNVDVMKTGEGRYELKYKPTIKGRHKLHVKINHQDIKGSPFTLKVTASNPLESLNRPIATYKGIWTAHGIMLSQKNEVIVTHWRDNCVSVITPDDNMSYTFDTRVNAIAPGIKKPHPFTTHSSKSEGEFNHPHQIAQDRVGNFYVTDFFNNRIQKFSPNWEFVKAVGTLSGGHVKLFNPAGVAYNAANGNLYVVEEGNHCVQILNTDLASSGASFGKAGDKEGELDRPWGIAFDSTGKAYVTDRMNHRIQVFKADGEYVREIGKDILKDPVGITIDTGNNIYVSESGNDYRIAVFNLEGEFVKVFGGQASEVSEPSHQVRYRGITVDDCGVVYACDEIGHSVLLY